MATIGCFALIFLVLHAVAAGIIRRKKRQARRTPGAHPSRSAIFDAIDRPAYLLIWIFGAYLAFAPLLLKVHAGPTADFARAALAKLFDAGIFATVFWLCLRTARVADLALEHWAARSPGILEEFFGPLLGEALEALVPVVGVLLALPLLGLPPAYHDLLAKATSLMIIGAVSWFLFRSIASGRDLVLARYNIALADNLRARVVHTQVRVITKSLYVGIGVLTIGCALMEFSEVRHVGASLLASAGILGVVGGLAAQSTLTNLFAGFQLAMAQPIRLDDVVVVEGAWGRIEEITLTYVIVHVWDDTRLVVPLSYFITKPFQNWTRTSSNIMGQVHFWTDYTLSVDELRPVVERIVTACPLWDRRFWNLQVVEADQTAMQLRILATASDSSRAWDLRCKIREEVLAYLQKRSPAPLPRVRAEIARAVGGAGNAAAHDSSAPCSEKP